MDVKISWSPYPRSFLNILYRIKTRGKILAIILLDSKFYNIFVIKKAIELNKSISSFPNSLYS